MNMREQTNILATDLATASLSFLSADAEELSRFMSQVGYDPVSLRQAMGTDELTHALLDYFAANESALLAMCANTGTNVSEFMRCWQALNPNS